MGETGGSCHESNNRKVVPSRRCFWLGCLGTYRLGFEKLRLEIRISIDFSLLSTRM
jgi:hypothetical protein